MPELLTLTRAELTAYVANAERCGDCRQVAAEWGAVDELIVNAVAIDPAGVTHAGDVVTGRTACGRDGNRWTWLVPGTPAR